MSTRGFPTFAAAQATNGVGLVRNQMVWVAGKMNPGDGFDGWFTYVPGAVDVESDDVIALPLGRLLRSTRPQAELVSSIGSAVRSSLLNLIDNIETNQTALQTLLAPKTVVKNPSNVDHDLAVAGPLTVTLADGTDKIITLAGAAIGRWLTVNPVGDAAITVSQQMYASGPWEFAKTVYATSASNDRVAQITGRVHAVKLTRTAGTNATSTGVLS